MGWLGMASWGGCGEQGQPLSDRSVASQGLVSSGTASSCVSWPSRIPTGSGRVGLRMPKWAALGLPGAEWGRGRGPTAVGTHRSGEHGGY